jgi:hypothetical protein
MLPPEPVVDELLYLWCFFFFLLVVGPDWSLPVELPVCPIVLPELPDCPIVLPELRDFPMLPELLPLWAKADIEAVRTSANASVKIFFMKSYFLYVSCES